MNDREQRTLAQLHSRFPGQRISADGLKLIHRGRFANAHVYRYRKGALDLIVKDFSHCPWWIRLSAAPYFVHRELRTLDRLRGLPGIASRRFQLSAIALAYPFMPGQPLSAVRRAAGTLPASFFRSLETLVLKMHERGIVHLDMRNLSNVLVGTDGRPYLIDFQSAIDLHGLPNLLSTVLESVDLSGVYKGWLRVGAEPLDQARLEFLDRFNELRRVWVFRGYPVTRLFERIREALGL